MTSPSVISPVPIYIGDQIVELKFWLMPRNVGDPKRIEGTMTVVAGEGNLVLDAIVGPPGIPGEPASIIRREWDADITTPEDLPALGTLDESDNGRAWYLEGQWHVYDQGEWHIIQGSIQGPPGVTPNIGVTAEVVEVPGGVVEYGPIDVDESGPSTAPNFHIKIPGIPGPEGPAASIVSASDYEDDDTPAEPGDFLVRRTDGNWGPGTPTFFVPRVYTLPHNSFIAHAGSEPRFLIGKLDVEAQDDDWYPDVAGRVRMRKTFLSSVQFEIEVRAGVTGASTGESEPLCGMAGYDPWFDLLDADTTMIIGPQFSDTGNPGRAVAPGLSTSLFQGGDPITFYVFVHKIGGIGNWEYVKDYNSQLRVLAIPAAD